MTSPTIPVSWGELLDKIAILEIKSLRLRAPEARANAVREPYKPSSVKLNDSR